MLLLLPALHMGAEAFGRAFTVQAPSTCPLREIISSWQPHYKVCYGCLIQFLVNERGGTKFLAVQAITENTDIICIKTTNCFYLIERRHTEA